MKAAIGPGRLARLHSEAELEELVNKCKRKGGEVCRWGLNGKEGFFGVEANFKKRVEKGVWFWYSKGRKWKLTVQEEMLQTKLIQERQWISKWLGFVAFERECVVKWKVMAEQSDECWYARAQRPNHSETE